MKLERGSENLRTWKYCNVFKENNEIPSKPEYSSIGFSTATIGTEV
jgi:hypothetical protein